ncbi:MAG: trypsin-like serine protease [Polyangiaceae bacterium]
MRYSRLGWIASLLCLVGCAVDAQEGESLGTSEEPVVSGNEGADAEFWGQVEVHYIGNSPNGHAYSLCSGTLLRNDVVLTARHCVTNTRGSIGGPIETDLSKFQLFMGDQTTGVVDIVDVRAEPGGWSDTDSVLLIADRFFERAGSRSGHRMSATRQPLPSFLGRSVLCFGYGSGVYPASFESAGVLRYANLPVNAATDQLLSVGTNGSGQFLTSGDSGGSCFTGTSEGIVLLGVNSVGSGSTWLTGAPGFREVSEREYAGGEVHVTSGANTSFNVTVLDDPALNDNPSALLIASQGQSPSGVRNPHPIGVYYYGGRWRIFNQDRAPMPGGAVFHYSAGGGFIHYVQAGNLVGSATRLDHPELNGNPAASFVFTLNWTARDTYFTRPLSTRYDSTSQRWEIYDVDGGALPSWLAMNVRIERSMRVVGTRVGSSAILTDANLNGNSDVVPFVTPRRGTWGSVRVPVATAYNASLQRWVVYTQDGSAMPPSPTFNVLVRP